MEQDVKQVGKFHHSIGANIVLLEEGTVAYRKEGSGYGIVFTKYPITTGVLFEVKIEEMDPLYRYFSGLVSTKLLGGIYNHTTTYIVIDLVTHQHYEM